MRARDIRFRGTDPRLYGVAQALGLDLAALDTRSLPGAVADAVEAQGMPDGADARALFADMLRDEGGRLAAHTRPAPLSAAERLKRERLAHLAHALAAWVARTGALPRYARPRADPAHGLADVFREVARREGARADAIKHWCMTDAEAQRLIASMRAVKAPSAPRKARRGLDRTDPLGDAGAALHDAWTTK